MNLLKISSYFNVYELAEVLSERSRINAIHGISIIKSHAALSKQGDVVDLIDELEQALSWRETDLDNSSTIIGQIASVDDKVFANSLAMVGKLQTAVLLLDEPTHIGKRKSFQESEDYIARYLAGEEKSSDKYVESLIDLFEGKLKLGDIPYKRKLSIPMLNLLRREETIILKKIKEYVRLRQKVLAENTIRITDENREVITGDLDDLMESIKIFEDFNIEINPTDDSLLLQGKEAQDAMAELIKGVKLQQIDFINIKSNEWGNTITIEAFYKNY